MVLLDLLTIAGLPTAVGASEAVHQQQLLDDEAEAPERQEPFYIDVYCDAQSRKKDEVHGTIIVLKDGKLRLWPKDSKTGLPEAHPEGGDTPHPFTGFFYPFPTEDLELPHRPIPAPPILGLVSTIPASSKAKSNAMRPKLNWVYADKETRELKYGPRAEVKHHTVGPWDWTEDEQGLTLEDEESLVAVEEEKGGHGWAVYWDREDDRLKQWGVLEEKRVLRCSLERRLVEKKEIGGLDDLFEAIVVNCLQMENYSPSHLASTTLPSNANTPYLLPATHAYNRLHPCPKDACVTRSNSMCAIDENGLGQPRRVQGSHVKRFPGRQTQGPKTQHSVAHKRYFARKHALTSHNNYTRTCIELLYFLDPSIYFLPP